MLQFINGESDEKKLSDIYLEDKPSCASLLSKSNKSLEPFFLVEMFEIKKKPPKKKKEDCDDDEDEDGLLNYKVPFVIAPELDIFVREVVAARKDNQGELIFRLDNDQNFNNFFPVFS